MKTEDDEILAGLTPEERAALEEPDDESTTATQGELEDAQGNTAKGQETGDADDESGKGKGGDGNGGAAADDVSAAAAAAGKPAGEPSGAGADEQGAAPGTQVREAPIYVAQAPADADTKLAEIASQKADLLTKFDDGDLTAKEYQAQIDVLAKQEREIERAIDKAQIAADMENQRQKNQWDADCGTFLSKHDAYKDPELFAHLNETIIAYAKMPRNAALSGPELLDRAHKAVMAERGTPVVETQQDKPRAGAPRPNLPPNLGGMPAASSNDPGEGKYASLDRLMSTNPEAYEKALAAMSEADRDAYLAA